jgi:tetratricopeptide (TPR) repeat protein
MKARERHHLKENELARRLTSAREFVEPRRKVFSVALVVAILLALGVVGVFAMRQRTASRAYDRLAEAMVVLDAQVAPPAAPVENKAEGAAPAAAAQTPGTYPTERAKLEAAVPKLKAAADAYPDATAGITARYRLASAYATLGRHKEAVQAYDEVIARDGDGLYARMARLGKAQELAGSGQYDAAITTFRELSESQNSDLPVDAILMQLGHAYAAAGKKDEAQKTFTKIVDEHPDSPYTQEARRQLELLKSNG